MTTSPVPSAAASAPSGARTRRSVFSAPRRLYRLLALGETITWTLLILGMVLKYGLQVTELGVRIGGGLHGFVFLAYCVVTVLVGIDGRWGVGRILLGLGSAIVPYLTIPFERWAERRGLLGSAWRLREDQPTGPVESLVAIALRRPVLAGVVALVAVAVVFSVLVSLGPPTQWFA